MNDIANRSLLLASYGVMSVNMALELVAHPGAKDHNSSILGLLFYLVILAALYLRAPAALVKAAAVLSAWIGLFGAYVLLNYVILRGATWESGPGLIVRFYFVVVVPAFAIRYFIVNARSKAVSTNDV